MQSIIISKLGVELKKDIVGEPQVVYILAEIRKYIDEYEPHTKNDYPNLYFLCNWVLHITMDRTPAIYLLQRFERDIGEVESDSLENIKNVFISKEISFYMFIDLKKEIRTFIKSNNLPNKLVSDVVTWEKFRYLLLEVLMDCPLVNDGGEIMKFSFTEARNKRIRFLLKIKNKGVVKITLKDETEKIMRKLGYKR